MKKNSKDRLFEVMGRLDKTFKPKLNEGFEEIEATTDDVEVPAEMGVEVGAEIGAEEPEVEEKSIEEKYEELKTKVEELHALINGGGEEEETAGEIEIETGELDPENLQEWNFDKKKGDKKDTEKDDDKSEEKEESETPAEEKEEELDEADAPAKKVPVAAIAKVGK